MRLEPALFCPLLLLPNKNPSNPSVFKRELDLRQSCPSGEKECGSESCIPSSYSCCPDGGGCPPGQYCSIGDNGVYGCCPDLRICTGDGGISTTGTYYYTSTSTDNSEPTSTSACDSSPITDADGAVYSVLCDTDFMGANDGSNVIGNQDNIASLSDCVDLCQGTNGCVAVDFYGVARPGFGPAGRCYLLSNTNPGTQYIAGETAASRISEPTPSSTYPSVRTSTSSSSSIFSESPTLSSDSATSASPRSSTASAAGATVTVTASNMAATNLSRLYEWARGCVWLAYSTTVVGTMFLAMIWL